GPHNHLFAPGIQTNDVKRGWTSDAKSAALADCIVDDAVVAPHHTAVDMDDIAGLRRPWLQALDNAGVTPLGNEADILTVRLVRHRQVKLAGERPHVCLGHTAQGKA